MTFNPGDPCPLCGKPLVDDPQLYVPYEHSILGCKEVASCGLGTYSHFELFDSTWYKAIIDGCWLLYRADGREMQYWKKASLYGRDYTLHTPIPLGPLDEMTSRWRVMRAFK